MLSRLLLAIALCLPHAIQAQILCMEPREPFCLQIGAERIADDRDAFETCRDDVQSFLKELRDYQQCISAEISARGKKVVDKFNCYAERRGLCL